MLIQLSLGDVRNGWRCQGSLQGRNCSYEKRQGRQVACHMGPHAAQACAQGYIGGSRDNHAMMRMPMRACMHACMQRGTAGGQERDEHWKASAAALAEWTWSMMQPNDMGACHAPALNGGQQRKVCVALRVWPFDDHDKLQRCSRLFAPNKKSTASALSPSS